MFEVREVKFSPGRLEYSGAFQPGTYIFKDMWYTEIIRSGLIKNHTL